MFINFFRNLINPNYEKDKIKLYAEIMSNLNLIKILGKKKENELTVYERGLLEVAKTDIKFMKKTLDK